MSEQEKSKASAILELTEKLPEQAMDLFIAYGQGLADMARRYRLAQNTQYPAESPRA